MTTTHPKTGAQSLFETSRILNTSQTWTMPIIILYQVYKHLENQRYGWLVGGGDGDGDGESRSGLFKKF
jgi:hypothetical protein